VGGEILFANHLVDEAGRAGSFVLVERFGEGEMEVEVVMLRRESLEVVGVIDFLPRASAIPITDAAPALVLLQQPCEVRPQRGHARSAADVDHFLLRRLDVEVAETRPAACMSNFGK
jgi:hypothetical protein